MIDIMVLRELFAEEFRTAESAREPRVARFDRLSDAEQERVYHDLKASGHELLWALQTQLPQLKRDGWEPLIKRDVVFGSDGAIEAQSAESPSVRLQTWGYAPMKRATVHCALDAAEAGEAI